MRIGLESELDHDGDMLYSIKGVWHQGFRANVNEAVLVL
jgi:hypothetical protein